MMKRVLIFIYQLCIWLPIFFVLTMLTALICILCCPFNQDFFAYEPPKWWSKLTCWITLSPVRVVGREHLKRGQSYIFIANHQGAYDIFLLFGFLGVPIKWVMKQSLRKIPVVGKACEMAGFIFVDNSSPVAAARTIHEAEKRLRRGASVVLFPEGSRSETGQLGKFKKGAYHMALDLHLPIVPVTINGSYEIMPKNSFLINPHRMELIIHPPIETANINADDLREAAGAIRQLTDRSREVIASGLWARYRA